MKILSYKMLASMFVGSKVSVGDEFGIGGGSSIMINQLPYEEIEYVGVTD